MLKCVLRGLSELKQVRHVSSTARNRPLSGNDMPRCGGITSFMRLPVQSSAQGLDACFLGIPYDCGASNRSGTRFGPRQIRAESALLRAANGASRTCPFEYLQVADIGDVPVNLYEMPKAMENIQTFVKDVLNHKCVPLTMGGDHSITLPILRAIKDRHGPVALIHVDAHSDTNESMMGSRYAHGTMFRRAVEEGLLNLKYVYQIGIRGTRYSVDDFKWPEEVGIKMIFAHECWHKTLVPLMRDIRDKIGQIPVYLSLDIDALDPAFAPGTGTPEIGGLTSIQMLEIIRGCYGLNIIGADMVEVSPPYDPSGNTALTAANLLFEVLCVLPKPKII